MERSIPGYHYDADKKKYFKILPNHIGRGSEYSSDTIRTKEAEKEASSRRIERQRRTKQQSIARSRLLTNPLLSFHHRIDSCGRRAKNVAAEYFCAAISPQKAIQPFIVNDSSPEVSESLVGPAFDIEEGTAALYTSQCRYGHYVIHRSRRDDRSAKCLWRLPPSTSSAFFPLRNEVDLLKIVPSTCVVFSETLANSNSRITAVGLGVFAFGEGYDGAQYRHSATYSITTDYSIWDIATAKHDCSWALATDVGIEVYDAVAGSKVNVPGLGRKAQMTVNYQGRHVVMAGSRAGRVRFADLRGGAIDRLRHSSGVNAVQTLRDDNSILVRGLLSMSLYDLRYAKAPTHHQKSSSSAYTTPYLSFAVPKDRVSDRYGLGFDVDSELGIVASATSNRRSHYVSLYSIRDGKRVRETPLNKAFDEKVTCIKIARIRDGPKSVLLGTGGDIQEWTALGTSSHNEE